MKEFNFNGTFSCPKKRDWNTYIPNSIEDIFDTIVNDYNPRVIGNGLSIDFLKKVLNLNESDSLHFKFKYENMIVTECKMVINDKEYILTIKNDNKYYSVVNVLEPFFGEYFQNLSRLVYLTFKGNIPPDNPIKQYSIDHINQIHYDNRIENLRLISKKFNYIRTYTNSEVFKNDFLKYHNIDEYDELISNLKKWADK